MNVMKYLVTAAVSAAMLCSVPAFADDTPDYLALGDSISAGYGLEDAEKEGFTALLAEAAGYDLMNHAVNGNTAEGILWQISDGSLDEAIQEAELITLTCGGNDMMALLYDKTAEIYNATGRTPITPDEVLPILADTLDRRWYFVLCAAQEALDGFAESEAFTAGLAVYEENLTQVITYLTACNPEAEIVVATQYNPYRSFAGHATLGMVDTSMDAGAKRLNEVIHENAVLGYTVAEVYDAFSAASENLCNATTSPMNLDFHPNATGHRQLAAVMLDTLGIECGHAASEDGFCVICGAAAETETTTEETTTEDTAATETTTTEASSTTEESITEDTTSETTATEEATTTEATTTTTESTTTETTAAAEMTTATEETTASESETSETTSASGMLPETGYESVYGYLIAAAAVMTVCGALAVTASHTEEK